MDKRNRISRSEKNSLLFYQGCVDSIILEDEKAHLIDFYRIPDIYQIMDAFLYPGISNEKVRICMESKRFNLSALSYIKEILNVYCDIYSAMCKYTYGSGNNKNLYTYRKDRMNSLEFLKSGESCSFMSTSKSDTIDEYFYKKDGLLLLEISTVSNIEHIDLNDVLGEESGYEDEKEILFPPFLYFDMETLEMTDQEKALRDINQDPPKGKYRLKIMGSLVEPKKRESSVYDELFIIRELEKRILDSAAIENIRQVWLGIESNSLLEVGQMSLYYEWKHTLQIYLRMMFSRIKRNILNLNSCDSRWNMLVSEIQQYKDMTYNERKKYKSRLQIISKVLSVLQPLAILCVALCFYEPIALIMKIVSLVIIACSAILTNIRKSDSLENKFMQRTVSFLALDELERDMRYDTDFSEENTQKYIDIFINIVKNDDLKCKEIIQRITEHLEELSESKIDFEY